MFFLDKYLNYLGILGFFLEKCLNYTHFVCIMASLNLKQEQLMKHLDTQLKKAQAKQAWENVRKQRLENDLAEQLNQI